jgi:hypothetical protein
MKAAGVTTQHGERPFHVDVLAFGEFALGLFDQYATVQCRQQLLVEHVAALGGALQQETDGGDIGQGLGDVQGPGEQRRSYPVHVWGGVSTDKGG